MEKQVANISRNCRRNGKPVVIQRGEAVNTAAQTTLIHAAELLEADAKMSNGVVESMNLLRPHEEQWQERQKIKAKIADALITALELRLLAKRIDDGQPPVSLVMTLTKGE